MLKGSFYHEYVEIDTTASFIDLNHMLNPSSLIFMTIPRSQVYFPLPPIFLPPGFSSLNEVLFIWCCLEIDLWQVYCSAKPIIIRCGTSMAFFMFDSYVEPNLLNLITNKRSRDHSLDTVWGLHTMKMKG